MDYPELPLELELAVLLIAAKAFPNKKYKLIYSTKGDNVYIEFFNICNSRNFRKNQLFENPIRNRSYQCNIDFIICFIPIYKYLLIQMWQHNNYFNLSYEQDEFSWESVDVISDFELAISKAEQKCFENFAVELFSILERNFTSLAINT